MATDSTLTVVIQANDPILRETDPEIRMGAFRTAAVQMGWDLASLQIEERQDGSVVLRGRVAAPSELGFGTREEAFQDAEAQGLTRDEVNIVPRPAEGGQRYNWVEKDPERPNQGQYFRSRVEAEDALRRLDLQQQGLANQFQVRLNPQAPTDTPWEIVERNPGAGVPDQIVQNEFGTFIRSGDGSLRQIRGAEETGAPGQIEIIDGERYIRQPDGRLVGPLPREAGIVQRDGRTFLQQPSGQLTPFGPSSIERIGLTDFVRDAAGNLQPLQIPNIDDIINRSILDGNFDAALAFDDFRNRPTSQEAFAAALAFAEAPADQFVISTLARGDQPVAQPTEPTRIGPQPDFLIEAFNELQRARSPFGDLTRTGGIGGVGTGPFTQLAPGLQNVVQQAQQNIAGAPATTPIPGTVPSPFEQRMEEVGNAQLQNQLNAYRMLPNLGGVPKHPEVLRIAQELGRSRTAAGTFLEILQQELDNISGMPGFSWEALGYSGPPDLANLDVNTALGLLDSAFKLEDQLIGQQATTPAAPPTTTQLPSFPSGTGPELGPVGPFQQPDRDREPTPSRPTGPIGFDPEFGPRGVFSGPGPSGGAGGGGQLGGGSSTLPGGDVPGGRPPGAQPAAGGSLPEREPGTGLPANRSRPLRNISGFNPNVSFFAGGGVTQGHNLEVVGEEGPELVDLPPGTHVIPLQRLSKQGVKKATEAGATPFQTGGIVFDNLPLDVAQVQAGRQINPPRGRLLRAAGLSLPSAQAFQNLTPGGRNIFRELGTLAGIPARDFEQELATAQPVGRRLPLGRLLPVTFRGIR
jgi:hypothetical protein